MTRAIYLLLGLGFTALGVVGAFLPLLPTTVFLILAAACFAKSSPRMEAWILDHKDFGPLVRAWRENGAIPRKAKVLACAGISTIRGTTVAPLTTEATTVAIDRAEASTLA